MGCCSSKPNPSSILLPHHPHPGHDQSRTDTNCSKLSAEIAAKEAKEPEEKLGFRKKEVFVIQHRRSHDKKSEQTASSSDSDAANFPGPEFGDAKTPASNVLAMAANGAVVRTSSCTKEEVDAILIQCGRLSRSSSGKGPVSGSARKYSGSKRSHDFDREIDVSAELNCDNGGVDDDERLVRRYSRGSHRIRTPSRSRERDPQDQRSGSRERNSASGGGSRRVSRSPGRRSDSPVTSSAASSSNGGRPGKMVSVPATVSVEKNSNDCNVKRVLVRRNVGEGSAASRGATPPRSRSPAARSNGVDATGVKVSNEGSSSSQQNQASLSRSSSRKAEHSPYRRTPLNEIDMHSLPFQPLANRANSVKGQLKCNEIEEVVVKQPLNSVSQDKLGVDLNNAKVAVQGAQGCRSRGNEAPINYCRVNENQPHSGSEQLSEDKREQLKTTGYDAAANPVIRSGGLDTVKMPMSLTRSRSSRRSRDLDINVEALLNPTPATDYNLLLLQDIQNFHQKTNATAVSDTNPSANSPFAKTPFSLPECLSKACSIVEAVADLNSSTKPNLSFTCADDRQKTSATGNLSYATNSVGGLNRHEKSKVPFMESEVNGEGSFMESSLHKYVTVRKGGNGVESFQGGDFDELESSGSNSYTSGSRHQGVSSSSWDPNSADSTDRWTSSRSRDGVSPVTLERLAFSKEVSEIHEDFERKLPSNHRRELSDQQQRGLSHSTVGAGR